MVNYSATSNNMKLVHWPLMVGLLHWYSEEGSGGLRLLTVPNVTVRPSTASVSFNVLLYSHYSGPFLCDFNVPVHNFVQQLRRPVLCSGRTTSVEHAATQLKTV